MLKDNTIERIEKTMVQKEDKGKGKINPSEGDVSKKTTVPFGSDDEIIEDELDAYIEEGENAGGEFPLNKDVIVCQDCLSNHLAELLVSNTQNEFN